MQILPIDTGRFSTKLHTKQLFPSVVGDWHERNLSNTGDYEVTINNKKYFVGELANSESYSPREMSTSSKIHEETRVLFLTGLCINATEESPIIITGVPVVDFNKETKEKMQDLLYGEYDVKVNDKYIHLNINNITLVPEGGASFWYMISQNPELEYGKKRIIDLGSRTVNFCTINGKQYINKDSDTLNYGTIKLKDNKITPEQLARQIVADLSQRWMNYDADNDSIILTGGGSLLLEKYLQPHFKNCKTVDNPVYANVLGYFRMGVETWVKNQIAK